jgi:hypothetical protein
VFRAAVLSIVLTLGAGPNAALLCAVWCHPQPSSVPTCPHHGASSAPQMTRENGCPLSPASAPATVRELQPAPSPQLASAVSTPHRPCSPEPFDRRLSLRNPDVGTGPPVAIALRI